MITFLYNLALAADAALGASDWYYQKQTATDLHHYVLDMSKHDDEVIVYEVQSVLQSVLIQKNNKLKNDAQALKHFFDHFFKGFSYFLHSPHIMQPLGTENKPDFHLVHPHNGIGGSKILQRLYFNANDVLQATMPNVVVVSRNDIQYPELVKKLHKGICAKPFVIKQNRASNGRGNVFIQEVGSLDALQVALQEVFDGCNEDCILVEEQLQAKTNPEKQHEDVYRCVCVQSDQKQFFNAQIVMRYVMQEHDKDSHRHVRCDSYAGFIPFARQWNAFGCYEIEDADPALYSKQERNSNLARHKPKLFAKLRDITRALSEFNNRSLAPYYECLPDKLHFEKVSFLSSETFLGVMKYVQAYTKNMNLPEAPHARRKVFGYTKGAGC